MENPPWKEVARDITRSIMCVPQSKEEANLCIAALMGLTLLEDCPAEYRHQVADLRLDGVWGPTAGRTIELVRSLIDS